MELNINSPKYYREIYGVDDEIYNLCQEMHIYFKDKSYSKVINVVGIIPIIAQKNYWKKANIKK